MAFSTFKADKEEFKLETLNGNWERVIKGWASKWNVQAA